MKNSKENKCKKKVILAVTSLLTNKVVVVTSDLLHLTANQVAGLGEGLRV